jgi:hypothetical protein
MEHSAEALHLTRTEGVDAADPHVALALAQVHATLAQVEATRDLAEATRRGAELIAATLAEVVDDTSVAGAVTRTRMMHVALAGEDPPPRSYTFPINLDDL